MGQLFFEEKSIICGESEPVLDALLRSGHDIPYGCRAGVCQSCVMAADSGTIPAKSQIGLSPAKVDLGYFLSCQCVPEEPLSVRRVSTSTLSVPGTVLDKTMLNDQVIRLRLTCDLEYRAGQYVTLWRDEHLGRSYSLASVPQVDDYLEFQIKLVAGGHFSQWLYHHVQPGDEIAVQGPLGECIFSAKESQAILLAAIGTGLSPIYGIARQALISGHLGPINLVIGARNEESFYLKDELQTLSEQYSNFSVDYVCQTDGAEQGDIYQFCKTKFTSLNGWRVYLCGAESFVKKMNKQSFLSGAAMGDISTDIFLPCPD